MNKPQKPRSESFSGLLGRLFGMKKPKPNKGYGHFPTRQAKSATATPVREINSSDPAARFRNLTSDEDTYSRPASGPVTANQSRALPFFVSSEEETPLTHPIPPAAAPAPAVTPKKRFFELSKTLPAFWTVASLLSFTINIILIVVLVLVGRELFALKAMVGNNLLGGLYENFIYMDQAHIRTNISVADNIPINFTLPISQDTVVVLTRNTAISGANVTINTGGISINSPANIILPAGTNLPVHLELQVPVTTTVPIKIDVPVDIPLQQTELHKPFIGLQQVVAPFYYLLQPQMKNPMDLPFCGLNSDFCSFYFKQ